MAALAGESGRSVRPLAVPCTLCAKAASLGKGRDGAPCDTSESAAQVKRRSIPAC